MMNRRGWIRILEATVAIMIVSGVMISVYSNQSVKRDFSLADYSYSLQSQILEDVASNSSLRLNVLGVEKDFSGDADYDILNSFVNDSIPSSFGYLLRICDLGDVTDFCKMDASAFISTLDKDVFVEEIIVASELGDGSTAIYSPKKVRLFFWEGGFPDNFCRDECSSSELVCSDDFTQVLNKSCEDLNGDNCLEYGIISPIETCGSGKICVEAQCISSGLILTCKGSQIMDNGCVYNYDDECANYDDGNRVGSCGTFETKEEYECWNYIYNTTECSLNPSCPIGYSLVSSAPCVVPTGTAVLSATITMGNVDSAFNGCSYNKCYYNISISNSGDAAGNVGKMYVDGVLAETYSESVVAGGSVNMGQEFVESDCIGQPAFTYNIVIKDSSGSSIGSRSISCSA